MKIVNPATGYILFDCEICTNKKLDHSDFIPIYRLTIGNESLRLSSSDLYLLYVFTKQMYE